MEKDMVFFGGSGLTSTSANHVANLAKEYIQANESDINSVSFYHTNVSIIGSGERNRISTGINVVELHYVPSHLEQIYAAKSLIAWLREAIKARENLLKDVNKMDLEEFCTLHNLTHPSRVVMEEILTEDKFIASLSIKERFRYYDLQTKAAVYGKYIHPDGQFSNARKDLAEKLRHQHEVSGNGRDTLIYEYKPSVEQQDVDCMFFNLQKTYRETQAELNGWKHRIETAISEDTQEKRSRYAELQSVYAAQIESLEAQMNAYKVAEVRRISSLKIIIPNDLREIYETVNSLGK